MTNAAAGWYDDGAGQQRWWDGARWTEHVAPLPVQQHHHQHEQQHQHAQQQPVAAIGWYDDGTGRQRRWDGQRWGAYSHSDVYDLPGGGIAMDVVMEWPLWFLLLSDQQDPTVVRARIHAGFDASTPPTFQTPDQLADVDIDDWQGAPLNIAVHTSQRELIASLGSEMAEILDDIANQVRSEMDRHAGGN